MQVTTVYQYFAGNGALIYVGVTDRGVRRLHEHAESKPWWMLATGCTLEHYETREAALDRERVLIECFRPPYNTQHNPERDIPLDERAKKRLRATRPQRPIRTDGLSLKERRRRWLSLTREQKLIAPCVVCGQRPGITGPACLNCRQNRALAKPTILASEHRMVHRRLSPGERCTHCVYVATHDSQRNAAG